LVKAVRNGQDLFVVRTQEDTPNINMAARRELHARTSLTDHVIEMFDYHTNGSRQVACLRSPGAEEESGAPQLRGKV
jgi:hypothetical protein